MLAAFAMLAMQPNDLDYVHEVASEVVDSAMVKEGGKIPGGPENVTGFTVRVPGGTQNYYPAFWIRDAAMMLGGDLVPVKEVEGWIRLVASVQPGHLGLKFDHGLVVPPYSIPDHITLKGEACWFPGAYADQGVGNYGFLPPADDAFYFVQMVYEQFRLSGKADFLNQQVKTGWGEHPLSEVCVRAFDSVDYDPTTALVTCDSKPGKGRVDWGFCDSVTKTGSCLMPSLLRWQAAKRLAVMFRRLQRNEVATDLEKQAGLIQGNLWPSLVGAHGMMFSATGLGSKDDIWASSFAVSIGILSRSGEASLARHLLSLYKAGGSVAEGQVRHMPPTGQFGGFWEKASSGQNTYQNGGYWATPTGWLIVALDKVDHAAARKLFSEYVASLRSRRAAGAPYEWINPATGAFVNGNYASSVGLVWVALKDGGFRP
jgi:hypothetical protein